MFKDRKDADRHLAHALWEYANNPDVIALAIPRGGAIVILTDNGIAMGSTMLAAISMIKK